ncbi:MAG: BON domain-containing protein [Hyphomonadaceae bacterium]|nr:MAG: phospholipid-binding protein [Caulobacteraceae bacterium]MBT9444467.1 BON domain-containing protein [Hyphomonadaceae bacterium]TPW07111.1 MAG: phospholipid-binding protein [Alphaproteobacteria bacterium]
MRTPLLILVAAGACALQTGCAAVSAVGGATIGMATNQDRTVGQNIDDSASAATVRTRLLALDRASYMRVNVQVAEGQLLLSGMVPTNDHKAMAERIAWGVRSVESVSNQLEVGRNAGLIRTGLDTFIATEIRTKLLSDAQVKGVNYNIEVERGVVYLMGVARSDNELQRAAETASTVRGVERVVSFVVVRSTDPAVRQSAARNPDAPVPDTATAGAPIISANN